MGVGLKGNTQTKINGGGGRVVGGGGWSRSYGLVLMFAFAFGAAIFGVVTLHKLREKRIFSLVLKDKDLQLNSLHLHLQKEREYAKEAKRKNEDMKEKLYSLRNQKTELNGRILEMQSTISSLKEEHKVMELALEEKQDEIKLIIEKEQDVNKENRHGTAPTQVLKHKEAEIEDLRRNLDLPVKVWSVSTDDPSNPPVNLITNVSVAQRDETELGENKENSGGLHERSSSSRDKKTLIRHADGRGNKSTTNGDGEHATEGEDGRENGVRVANTREMNGEEQSQKLESFSTRFWTWKHN